MTSFKQDLPKALRFSDLMPGLVCSFETTLTMRDIRGFAKLTGDHNPLHLDAAYARKYSFKENIIHGMLLGGLFSRLVGMHCPGKEALFLTQYLEFRRPVFAGDRLLVKGTVVDKSDSTKIVTLKTEVLADGKVAVSGEARVLFRGSIQDG